MGGEEEEEEEDLDLEMEEGARMEALVAINWCGWEQVREKATKTCTFSRTVWDIFEESESSLSTFIVNCIFISSS